MTEHLIEYVNGLVESGAINTGQGNSFVVKLRNVLKNLEDNKAKVACNTLNAFTNQITSLVGEGELNLEDGQNLLDAAGDISTQICH